MCHVLPYSEKLKFGNTFNFGDLANSVNIAKLNYCMCVYGAKK